MAPSPQKTPNNRRRRTVSSKHVRGSIGSNPSPARRSAGKPKVSKVSQNAGGAGNQKAAGPSTIGSYSNFMGEEHKFAFDDDGLHIPTGNSEILLSRRQLLYGAAGLAAAGVIGTGVKIYSDAEAEKSAIYTLEVAEDAVFSQEDCQQADKGSLASNIASLNMPYGTLIWSSSDTVAACLIPTEKSKPIAKIGILSMAAGSYTTVIDQAQEQDAGYEIYDVRMSENGMIWTESNVLQGSWSVWAAPVVGLSVGDPVKVEEGDANWELPSLAAAGSRAYWQLRPSLSGTATAEESSIKSCQFTNPSQSKVVYTSNGRFATDICSTGEGIVISPRHPESSSYYQLVHIDGNTLETTDSITLPSLMTPLEVGYGPYGFTFSFQNIYSYGGGIANLGTYTPVTEHNDYQYDGLTWFRFGRTPSVAPCWCNGKFVVKSTTAVALVDTEAKSFCTLSLDNDIETYGDVLCSTGVRSTFVTTMNVDDTATMEASGKAEDATRKCIVRCWQA